LIDMKDRVALVLSAGGMFGAWQAGAWRAVSEWLRPDLVVGASVGSLNGYAIAGGATPEELIELWRRPEFAKLGNLSHSIQELMARYPHTRETAGRDPVQPDFAVVLTDLLRMKPRTFQGREVTWRHLAASCAVPGFVPFQKIDGRIYGDGGLLNPLPVWAAVDSGATRIIALHALPVIPSLWLRPLVSAFRSVAGHRPPLREGVRLQIVKPAGSLGSMTESLRWRRENIERWLEMGYQAGKNISLSNCSAR
jgi:NTE family protein